MNSIFTYKGRIPTLSGGNYIPGFEMVTPGLTYGRFAAVRRNTGVNQRAMWSNDGISWNIATTPNSLNYLSVDFSPEQGLWVATSTDPNSSNIMTSTNSVTWTSRSKPDTTNMLGVAWCKSFNKWIANGLTKIFVSDDAITWTIGYTYSTFNSHTFEPVYADTPDGPVWGCVLSRVGAGTGVLKVCYTTDGSSFTEVDISSDNIWVEADGRTMRYSPELNRFCIFNSTSNSSRILTSTDIASGWSYYTQSVAPSGAGRIGSAWGEGLFVSPMQSGSNTTTPIQYSSLGTNGSWTASTFPNAAYSFFDVEYAPEIDTWFVVRTNQSNGFSSNDGITWTQRTVSGTEFSHVSWGAGVRTTGYKEGAGIT
jgi:hypothetical protein